VETRLDIRILTVLGRENVLYTITNVE